MIIENQACDRNFILQCIRKAYETNTDADGMHTHLDTDSQDSVMLQYCYEDDASNISNFSKNSFQDDDTVSTPSLQSDIDVESKHRHG